MVRRQVQLIAPLVALVMALVLGTTAAHAGGGPEKVFAGKVVVSDKRFPTAAKSPAAYTALVRKQAKVKFQENKATKGWKIHFAAFLRKPLADIEVSVKILDASTRPATLLSSFDQYLDTRGQRAIISSFTLERSVVGVNKSVTIQLESGGVALATGKFQILGDAEVYSGKVDFSESDTK